MGPSQVCVEKTSKEPGAVRIVGDARKAYDVLNPVEKRRSRKTNPIRSQHLIEPHIHRSAAFGIELRAASRWKQFRLFDSQAVRCAQPRRAPETGAITQRVSRPHSRNRAHTVKSVAVHTHARDHRQPVYQSVVRLHITRLIVPRRRSAILHFEEIPDGHAAIMEKIARLLVQSRAVEIRWERTEWAYSKGIVTGFKSDNLVMPVASLKIPGQSRGEIVQTSVLPRHEHRRIERGLSGLSRVARTIPQG